MAPETVKAQLVASMGLTQAGEDGEALRWATSESAQGNYDALCLLGDAHWAGELGLAVDESAAIECWQRVLGNVARRPAPSLGSDGPMSSGDATAACAHECCAHRTSAPPPPAGSAAPAAAPSLTATTDPADSAAPPPPAASATPLPLRVAIIGAGPSGLVCLKECLARGFNATAFEVGPCLGGVFASAYEGALLTSSSAITAFGDFPMNDATAPVFYTAAEYAAYLDQFSDAFGLRAHIRLNCRVRTVRREADGRWALQVSREGGGGGKIESTSFDAIAVCAGLHQHPVWPIWANKGGEVHPRTRFVHSSELGSACEFAGQRVCVVGLGESGSDISLLVAQHAAAVIISTRNGPGAVVPRFIDPPANTEPADLSTNRRPACDAWGPAEHAWLARSLRECAPGGKREAQLANCFLGGGRRAFTPLERDALALNARHGSLPYNRFGTKNLSFLKAVREHGVTLRHADVREVLDDGTVLFDDGSSFAGCDVVVLCTGYSSSFPFFEAHMPTLAQREADARGRFKHIFCPDLGPTLAFIGYARPAFGAVPPLSELGARYWVQLLARERDLPANLEGEIARDRKAEERLFRRDAMRLSSLVQFQAYLDGLARLIGCMPNLRLLRRHHPAVHRRVVESACCAAQFRLHGPGACEAAWLTLGRMVLPRHKRQPRCAAAAKRRAMAAFDADATSSSDAPRSLLWADDAAVAVKGREEAADAAGGIVAAADEEPSQQETRIEQAPANGAEAGREPGSACAREDTAPAKAGDEVARGGALLVPSVRGDASDDALVAAIEEAARTSGLLRLRMVPGATDALEATALLFDTLGGLLPTSLDDGVSCKGAWLPADGSGSASRPKGDLKLVLDLESTELASAQRAASLFPTLSGAALPALDALDAARRRYIPLVHAALARVIPDASIRDEAEATVLKYRLCDYPAHVPLPGASTRCSEHTDYGTATLIFEDGQPGLEVWQAEEWRSVPPGARGDALLIFGWCSYQRLQPVHVVEAAILSPMCRRLHPYVPRCSCVRSNGRVRALKHRVMVPPPEAVAPPLGLMVGLPSRAMEPPPPRGQGGGTAAPAGLLVPRRVSLVLFAAPPHSARLDPVSK